MSKTTTTTMTTKKLIVESDCRDYTVVTEALSPSNNTQVMKLQGIFMEAETINNNNRKYHLAELVQECKNFQSMIQSGRALSELEHPEEITINPDRVCCRILKLQQSSDNKNQFLGEAVVTAADPAHGLLGTPKGTLLASLLQYGTKVGFSTRGLGNPGDDDYVSEFQLITIDTVLDPSIGKFSATSKETKNFVNGILESRQFLVDMHGEIICEQVKKLDKAVSVLPKNGELRGLKLKHAVDEFLRNI